MNAYRGSWSKCLLILMLSIGLYACGSQAPVATKYKQEHEETSAAVPADIPTSTDSPKDSISPEEDEVAGEAQESDEPEELLDETESTSNDIDPEQQAAEQAEQIKAQMVQIGTAAYNEKCASCHLVLEMSEKLGRTAVQITDAEGVLFHNGIAWPDEQEALALEAALAQTALQSSD